MINKILMGVMSLIISLVNVILTPIDAVIRSALPGLDEAFSMVGSLLSMVTDIVPWVMSWFGLNTTVRTLVVSYFVFILSVPLIVHSVKLAIKWYDKLKP